MDVNAGIDSLKPNKAPGFDKVPSKLIKLAKHHINIPLMKIYNNCVDKSIFPDALKLAEISPAYKKEDKLNKCNYRPWNFDGETLELDYCSDCSEGFYPSLRRLKTVAGISLSPESTFIEWKCHWCGIMERCHDTKVIQDLK